jgi:hypothetical protein
MAAQITSAREPEVIKTDWTGFQQRATHFRGRTIRVSDTGGAETKSILKSVEANGISVESKGSTKLIPRESVSRVRVTGRTGKGGLIGALAGLGAGAAIAGGVAASDNNACEAGTCLYGIIAVPITVVAGWLIGRSLGPPAPTFVIER